MFETEERLSIYKDRKYKVIFNKKEKFSWRKAWTFNSFGNDI